LRAAFRLRALIVAGKHLTATASVALIFVLGLLAVVPEAHAWLHPRASSESHASTGRCHHDSDRGHTHPLESDAGCVVDLFAQGVEPSFAAFTLAIEFTIEAVTELSAPHDLRLSPPRYLRQPERGPPARV